jgi:hypothetical protein
VAEPKSPQHLFTFCLHTEAEVFLPAGARRLIDVTREMEGKNEDLADNLNPLEGRNNLTPS